ncbi:MAG: SDR family oxidoreductase [Myxococcota bacterium]|nr:SDR family oxidoreductase [Myxococcota bacterium]
MRRFGLKRLQGSVVVVTGASSGVGRATVRALGAAGVRVGLIARNREALENAAEEIRELGGEALVLEVDVANAEAVDAAADEVVRKWGRLDGWVNNAMVSVFAPVKETSADEYRRVTEVNYLGYVHGTLCALRHMRRVDAGVIVQIGSALAYRSIPLQSAYCASKAAIRGFTDSLRSELHHDHSNIGLTMLQLPAVNTPQFQVVRSRLPLHPQPVPPIYQPELIGEAVLHALSHPTRERWLGWSATKAILGQRVIPGLLDRYLAKKAYSGQQSKQLSHVHHSDNVDAPLPGDRGAHGEFDARARGSSKSIWLNLHRGQVALAVVAAAAAVGLAQRRATT